MFCIWKAKRIFFFHFVFRGLSSLFLLFIFFKWKIKNRTLWLLRSTHSNSIPVAKQQGPCTSTMNGFWAAGLYKQLSRVVFITTGVNTLGHTRGKENVCLFQILLVLNIFPKCFQNSPWWKVDTNCYNNNHLKRWKEARRPPISLVQTVFHSLGAS